MKVKLISNTVLKGRYYLMEITPPPGIKSAVPGQFLHTRIGDSCSPLLRRPFSIHDVVLGRKGILKSVRIVYEVVGKGTQLLSEKRPGSKLDVLGPLGEGFDVGRIQKSEKIYLVAGGIGVAPLFFLAKKLAAAGAGTPGGRKKIVILIGAKTKQNILCKEEFKSLGCEVAIATEDASYGKRGMVTDVLTKRVSGADSRRSVVCACGPKAMLAVTSEICAEHNMPAYGSLEEFMGCGIGACLGCVIKTTSGYKRICHDGPVFNMQDIVWHGQEGLI